MKRVLLHVTHSIDLARKLTQKRNQPTPRFDTADPDTAPVHSTVLVGSVVPSMARTGTPTMLHEEPMQGVAGSTEVVSTDPVNIAAAAVMKASGESESAMSTSPEQQLTPNTTPSKKNKGRKKKEDVDFVVKEF